MDDRALRELSAFRSPSPPEQHTSIFRRHPPRPHNHPRPYPPRLSSPRLFVDLFAEDGSRRSRILPPMRTASGQAVPQEQNEAQTFANAIRRASRAVESTGQAFQARAGPSNSEIVDLTDSPPAEGRNDPRHMRDSEFAMATHPQDSRQQMRGLSTLHQPIFGYAPIFAPGPPVEDRTDSAVRARHRRARIIQNQRSERRHFDERAEREAIRRQQENHAAWQRTQARTRQLREQHESESAISAPQTPTTSAVDSIFGDSRDSSPFTMPSTEKIESVDLTKVDDNKAVAAVLAKQRADAIEAQKPNTSTEAGRTTFTAYKCPICMESLKDATTTVCGHLFCHKCIIDTLKWSAAQRQNESGNRKINGVCPVCRKPIGIRDVPGNGRTLVPVELKFLTKKRKRDDKGKGKAVEVDAKGKGKKMKRETSQEFFSMYINDEY